MKRQRGTGSVFRRRGSRVWWIKYYAPGSLKPIRESSGTQDRRAAEKLLKHRVAEVALGQFKGVEAERATFEDLAKLIVDDYVMNERRSMNALNDSLRHLRPSFSRFRVKAITSDKFSAYIRKRLDEGAAPATIRKERAALKRMFTLGQRAGLVVACPYLPSIDVHNARENFFEHGDYLEVLKHLSSDDATDIAPVVEFAYITGWRKQEILGLKWADVSFDHGEVRLRASRSKNYEGRTFPFRAHPRLKQLLEAQRQWTSQVERAEHKVVQWVFHRRGERIKDFRGAWYAACERAGVPNYWFHDLRRSAVRNLVQAGVPEIVAMKLTGHKTRAVFQRYAITDKGMLEEAVRKLADVAPKSAQGTGRVIAMQDTDG